jgi:hypothetical protein
MVDSHVPADEGLRRKPLRGRRRYERLAQRAEQRLTAQTDKPSELWRLSDTTPKEPVLRPFRAPKIDAELATAQSRGRDNVCGRSQVLGVTDDEALTD